VQQVLAAWKKFVMDEMKAWQDKLESTRGATFATKGEGRTGIGIGVREKPRKGGNSD